MRNYMTISEFAKLRNININSLRYYEKIGILRPAYTDPETKYRYYTPQQLSVLDTILLCIDLEIPLKSLNSYKEGDYYWAKKILEDGKKIGERKIKKIKTGLKRIEYTLACQEEQEKYSGEKGIYKRRIRQRFFIAEGYRGALNDEKQFEQMSIEMFDYAQSKGLSPVLPGGYIMTCKNGKRETYIFFDILATDFQDEKIMKIPDAEYSCCRIKFSPAVDLNCIIKNKFGSIDNGIIIVAKLLQYKFETEARYNEIQVLTGF